MNASETLAQRSQGQDDYHVNPISNEGAMTATETKTNCSNVYLDEREARNAHMAQEIKEMFEEKDKKKSGMNTGLYPRRVNIWFHLWKLRDIETVDESFTVDLTLSASWIEDDLENNPFLNTLSDKDTDPRKWEERNFSWVPHLRFLNLIERDGPRKREDYFRVEEYHDDQNAEYDDDSKVHKKDWFDMDDSERRSKKWKVTQEMTIKASFSEKMELQGFPFDIQPLHIKLTSTRKLETVVLSFEDQRPCSLSSNALESQEFRLHSPRLVSYDMGWNDDDEPLISLKSSSSSGRRYSRAYIVFTVTRKPQYYLWNFYLVLFILGSLTLTIFLEDHSSSNRTSNVLTLLLSLIAFRFVMSQNLPIISYLTILDTYNLITLTMTALLVVYSSVFRFHSIYDIMNDELGQQIDNVVGLVFTVLWATANLHFLLYTSQKNLKRTQKVATINHHFSMYRNHFLGDDVNHQYKRCNIYDGNPKKLNYIHPLFGAPKELTYYEIVKHLFS